MSQKAFPVVVALAAAVVGFVVSDGCFGGSKLRPTSKPKLESGWSPWQSWKGRTYVGLPPTYVEYATSSAVVSQFARGLEESNPGMREKLEEGLDAPDRVITAFELNANNAESFIDHFTVYYKKGWPKMSLEEFVSAMKKDASKTFPNSRNVTAEEVKHPNGRVAKVEYDTTWERKDLKPVPLHVISYVFIDGDDAHLLTFTTPKDRLDKSRPVFEKCFETFRVTS